MSNPGMRFSTKDLEKWVEVGLITPDQSIKIQAFIEDENTSKPEGTPGVEQRRGLNLITLAYYFGGFMILLAYTIYMGLEWDSLSHLTQVFVSLATILFLWGIGYFLKKKEFRVAGNLLIFVGTGIVPLLITSIQRAAGLWPNKDFAYGDFYSKVSQTWIPLELITIVITIVVLWRVRYPLLTFLISFWIWFLTMDLSRLITHSTTWSWSDTEKVVSTVFGGGLLLLGIYLQRRTKQDFSFWFFLFGHIIIYGFFCSLSLKHEGLLGILFFITYILFVIMSVWLQRKVFLVFGALGCYGYMGYLAFHVFEGRLGFIYSLAGIGLLIILTAVGYQKYAKPWLEKRFKNARIQQGDPK